MEEVIERFSALDALSVCRAAFVKRIPGVEGTNDKDEALRRLEIVHADARRTIEIADWPFVCAKQVHGNAIMVLDSPITKDEKYFGHDGFVTNQQHIALGVYVADCCAVYIVDPKTRAIGLVHSGKKGTELGIAAKAIDLMREHFGTNPGNLVVQLSPCIRPPHYEIDFAARIREQCQDAGVTQIHDSGVCTACDLNSYYSYRAEKGKTGRMLALLGLT